MWLWEGWHCRDLVVLRMDPKTLVSVVEAKLREWGVEECNFTYDMQGIGQYFKGFFKDAVPFNNQAAPVAMNHQEEEGIKYLYKDLKSQCAFLFYKMIKEKQISIDSSLSKESILETDSTRFPSDRFSRRSARCSDVTRTVMTEDSSYCLRRLPRSMSDTRLTSLSLGST